MPSYDWIKQHEEVRELENKLKIMERNVKELQEQLQASYKRIGELTYKRDMEL